MEREEETTDSKQRPNGIRKTKTVWKKEKKEGRECDTVEREESEDREGKEGKIEETVVMHFYH